MTDIFDVLELEPEQKKQVLSGERVADAQDIFDVIQPANKESTLRSWVRSFLQVPAGIAQAITYPLDLMQHMGLGAALDPEEIEHIRKISEREGIPFDEERYREAAYSAASSFPTQSNIERLLEEKVGIPLEPKTRTQKGLRLAGTAGKFAPGTITQKAAAAATAPAVSTGLEQVGVPEPLAELAGLGVSGLAARKAPAVTPKIKQVTKPSGLPKRRFEKLKEPRVVSAAKKEQIHQKLEGDFRKISDEIIAESPVAKTKATLEENPAFKSEVSEQFKKVESLSEQLPEKISTNEVKKSLMRKAKKKEGTGFSPSEYDKDYKKFINEFIKETPTKDITAKDLVSQYRKNNKSLSEAYDPSRSRAFNRAKKDALLDYNRSLADLIEQKYPKSEFSNLFKETNKQWAEIADAEAIDKFIDGMFDGEVKFKKGRRFFEYANEARPFKRALGAENFPKFEQLMKDMLSSEKPAKMLKIAKQKGFGDLVETAGAYIIHPTIGKAKLAYDVSKNAFQSLVNAAIDKPQLMFTWEKGVDALKKGNFQAAEKSFASLESQVKQVEKSRPLSQKEEAFKRFREHQKKKKKSNQ